MLLLLALAMNRKRPKKKKKGFFYTGQKEISNSAQTNSQTHRFKNFRGHSLSPHSFLATLKTGHASIWRQAIRISSCSSSRPAQTCPAHCIFQTAVFYETEIQGRCLSLPVRPSHVSSPSALVGLANRRGLHVSQGTSAPEPTGSSVMMLKVRKRASNSDV